MYWSHRARRDIRMFSIPAPLPDDPAALQLILRAAMAEIERLTLLIAGLQRHRFSPSFPLPNIAKP